MKLRTFWPLLAAALLTACGGGGGSAVRPDPFVSFFDIAPRQTVEASAISQTADVTVNMSGLVTSRILNAADTDNSSVQLGYNASLDLIRLSISTPQSSVTWSGAAQISCDPATCAAENANAAGVAINPFGLLWNYQTFGFWIVETGSTTGMVGVISLGNPTPVDAIPTSGTASYTGITSGFYVDTAGIAYGYGANMSAMADFGAGSVGFSTSGTQIVSTDPFMSTPDPTLDLSGTLAIPVGANAFSGSVSNTAGMTGTATGRFYGPLYEEIGGVFGLTGTGATQSLIGAFGGKR
jgi:hypothetical protein